MIVNTAYIYMGSAGGPANPVIFQQNEINYGYSVRNCTETPDGFKMGTGISWLVFTGLDLSNFKQLEIGASTESSGVSITVTFTDNSGNVSAGITKSYSASSTSYNTYDIPVQYRNPETEIKFATNYGKNILLQYAKLS